MDIFSWKFVHNFNSNYTRHNSRLYELLFEFCDAAWNQIYNSYLTFVCVTRLMIRVGIKNSLASHVLYFMWISFFKNLVEKKNGMCLIQKNFMKMKTVKPSRLVPFNMTMLMITFSENSSENLQHSDSQYIIWFSFGKYVSAAILGNKIIRWWARQGQDILHLFVVCMCVSRDHFIIA